MLPPIKQSKSHVHPQFASNVADVCPRNPFCVIQTNYDMHLDSQVSEGTSSYAHHPQRQNSFGRSPINLIDVAATDAIDYLHKIFPPLEFPADVAQRMTTHVSWERGVKGHNGRLGFVGRRVLHTYLLLFLHECTLAPPSHNPPKNAPIPPSSRLRSSSFYTGGPVKPLIESYDDISEKLLNTYVLGEHVGAAWELERIMRWTPAVAEFDALKAQSPDTVLRSSGLYKVRGATVEGVVGGIFHQYVRALDSSCKNIYLLNIIWYPGWVGSTSSISYSSFASCLQIWTSGILTLKNERSLRATRR